MNTSEWLLTKILKNQKNIGTHFKNESTGFRFLVKLQANLSSLSHLFLLLSYSQIAILQCICTVLVVKTIGKYLKEFNVNNATGPHTTTLIKIQLFDRYFFQGFCPKGENSYVVEHLRLAACKNLKKRKNTQTHLKNDSKELRFLVKLQARMPATLLKIKNSFTGASNPAGIYLLKVNNRNTSTRCEICSNLTVVYICFFPAPTCSNSKMETLEQ